MLAHDAALEYGVRGITVNSVAPGVTLTHMAKDVLSPEFIQEVKEGTPLKKVGLPKDVGRILRTFKIKKNVEVTDNGKIII